MTDLIDLASEQVGWHGLGGQRRVLRPCSQPGQGDDSGVAGGRLHRPWQVDGRVGEPSASLAGT